MKKLVVGILAHVDAGKTTLSEALLYQSGKLRKLGRVDNRDSFLDNHELERKRGITIFSKQALLEFGETAVTLLDTPGHADFSAEMERALKIMDVAILVISGTDGTQAHTDTLWKLLERYAVPTFVFVTKMDVSHRSEDELMEDLRTHLSPDCLRFTERPDDETFAMMDEGLLDKVLSGSAVSDADIAALIGERKLFPCYFGSGLKLDGIDNLIDGLQHYTQPETGRSEFGAVVYKIARDAKGKRLTYAKITGGSLSVRDSIGEEKISEIRLYSGQKYESVDRAEIGDVCALIGLSGTVPGQGLGVENDICETVLEPVMGYQLILPKGTDPRALLPKLKLLEEEDPTLRVTWNEVNAEIGLHLMGDVQTEILCNLIRERFNTDVQIGPGRILYKETITEPVEGIGHYEPLRHYAEVHLLLEPAERNSGLSFASSVSTDDLNLNWQRLIQTHLAEKTHLGVLTGAPLTDVRITLIAGRAHVKHTEGGDFRQATYRAVRQGLMRAKSILLEPYYEFILDVPTEAAGRAISDIHAMDCEDFSQIGTADRTIIRGCAPVAKMAAYPNEVLAYTGGRGRLSFQFGGYRECADAQKIIEATAYNPEADLENSPDSIFCSHGAGVNVSWKDVPALAHIEGLAKKREETTPAEIPQRAGSSPVDEAELEAIMVREFGPIRRKSYAAPKVFVAETRPKPAAKEHLVIDGYNVIFAWEDLKALAADNIDAARERLIDIMANYCGFTNKEAVLVFDAYMVPNGRGERDSDGPLHVVYTREGESADMYIEKFVSEIGKNETVRVVTSDSLIGISAMRSGVLRSSSSSFRTDVDAILEQMRQVIADGKN